MRRWLIWLVSILVTGCGNPVFKNKGFEGRLPTKGEVLVGEINRDMLLTPPHDRWFTKCYNGYSPDPDVLEGISVSLKEIDSVRVFIGTWCLDSKIEVPKLFKILDENDFSEERVRITALEYSRTALENIESFYQVEMIPTIIFYKNGKELNRFVEYSRRSFEEDLSRIVSDAEYRHEIEK